MSITTLSNAQRHRTVASMERHGGGFCRALAQAWYVADIGNKRRLEDAFAHILEDFAPGSGYYSDEY
jgi:hypothetical protein